MFVEEKKKHDCVFVLRHSFSFVMAGTSETFKNQSDISPFSWAGFLEAVDSSLLLSLPLSLSLSYRPAVAGSRLQLVIGYLHKKNTKPSFSPLNISSHLYPFLCISTFNLPYTDLFRQNFLTRILPARLEKDRYHFSVFVTSLAKCRQAEFEAAGNARRF